MLLLILTLVTLILSVVAAVIAYIFYKEEVVPPATLLVALIAMLFLSMSYVSFGNFMVNRHVDLMITNSKTYKLDYIDIFGIRKYKEITPEKVEEGC